MRTRLSLGLLAAITHALAGCSDSPGLTPSTGGGIDDVSSLVIALRQAGASVELGESVSQPFFAVSARIVRVNGEDAQVFVYPDEASARADASQVSADGSTVGTSIVTWVGPPHFFRSGRVLVLYVGSSESILSLLTNLLGPQFAGR